MGIAGCRRVVACHAPSAPAHLERVPRTAAFRTDRAAAAAWVEGQFRLIESAVPGLERAGMTVEDGCWLSRDVHGWVISHGDRWHISCTRTVTAVYGASGTAATPIRELAVAEPICAAAQVSA